MLSSPYLNKVDTCLSPSSSKSPQKCQKNKDRSRIQMMPPSMAAEEIQIEMKDATETEEKEKEKKKKKKSTPTKTTNQKIQEELEHPEFMTLTSEETLFSLLYGCLCMLFSVLTYKFSLDYVWLYWMYPFTYVWSGVAGNMFVHVVLYNWAPRDLVVSLLQIHDFRTDEISSLTRKQKIQVGLFGLCFVGLAVGNMYLTEGISSMHWMYPLTFFYAGVAGNILIALFFVPIFSKKFIRVLQKVHDIH